MYDGVYGSRLRVGTAVTPNGTHTKHFANIFPSATFFHRFIHSAAAAATTRAYDARTHTSSTHSAELSTTKYNNHNMTGGCVTMTEINVNELIKISSMTLYIS